MIKPGDKVSWLEGDTRKYGWVHAIINRGAYQTALLEKREIPLGQLTKERVR
ncbi:hypothetical protein [Secundilactobacillus muriivasis]